MKLIDTLSSQLGGRPEWRSNDPGTRFVLEFFVKERLVPQV